MSARATSTLRAARKVTIAVLGFGVLALGVTLIVLPGPAVIVIPLGLTILASEFAWARTALQRLKARARWLVRKLHRTAPAEPKARG